MYNIILEWIENDRQRSEQISSEDSSKEKGKIFIGRDDNQCDVILPTSEKSVSRLHAVMFYDSHNHCFFLKNLTSNRIQPNPIIVDGKIIISEQVVVALGSVIQLGRIFLKVRLLETIQFQQSYGLKCLNGHQIAYDYIGDFCPHCGFSLQAVETTFVSNLN